MYFTSINGKINKMLQIIEIKIMFFLKRKVKYVNSLVTVAFGNCKSCLC